ncbi:MAG: Hsp20 family protein [Alphaproteobacteria bacterium]|nr:Hsp20 family protein [Alphaproteobacteria bacterium]
MFGALQRRHRSRSLPATRAPYSPDPFLRMHEEMNRFLDDAFSVIPGTVAFGGELASFRAPQIDVRETDGALEIIVELPGVAEDDIDVEINDTTLVISGEKKFDRKETDEDGAFRLMERSSGTFARSVPLGFRVEPDAVDAIFRDGVLSLRVPKPAEDVGKRRRIAIRRG